MEYAVVSGYGGLETTGAAVAVTEPGHRDLCSCRGALSLITLCPVSLGGSPCYNSHTLAMCKEAI